MKETTYLNWFLVTELELDAFLQWVHHATHEERDVLIITIDQVEQERMISSEVNGSSIAAQAE